MKTVILQKNEAVKAAAEQVKEIIERKPKAVLAVDGGESVRPLLLKLAEMCAEGEISFSDVALFLISDYERAPVGMYLKDPLIEDFIDCTDIYDPNVYYINSLNYQIYDEVIESRGGIDLAVVSPGADSRIGFNEPGTEFLSQTHIQKLAPATRRELAREFGGEENVPENALTMGIKNITDAAEQIVLAFGEEKAEPVFHMLYGRTDSRWPAAFLQIPKNVTVYLDEEAASKL